MFVLGIEEAGRGPVIGPMVMVGLLIDSEDEKELIALKVKDSKLLTPQRREALFDKIKAVAKKTEIAIISPEEIDNRELAGLNLNQLEAVTAAGMINKLKPDKVILDCPSSNVISFKAYLKKRLDNEDIEIVAEHKADVNYPVVSAASIIAKVTRDREVEKIRKKIRMEIGSGYPADPITKKFLEEHGDEFPQFIRHTWATEKTRKAKQEQKGLGEFK